MLDARKNIAETWKQRLGRRFFLWLICDLPNHRIDGLWIGTFDRDHDVLPRIENALHLIKIHDRLRYDRLLRDLERILVCVLLGDLACFNHRYGSCELDARFVLAETSSPEVIAATIVHEATHARLWSLGVRYEQKRRHRIEAICFRRVLAFATKLPNSELVREQAENRLTGYAGPESWTNAVFEKRLLEGAIEAMRYRKFPWWLIQILLWMRKLLLFTKRCVRSLKRLFRSSVNFRSERG
jgi:hypothetical protein